MAVKEITKSSIYILERVVQLVSYLYRHGKTINNVT